MRLASVRTAHGVRPARIEGDEAVLLPGRDLGAFLGESSLAAAKEHRGERLALNAVAFAPLIPSPSKIFCIGFNYVAHVREMGQELPAHPSIFAKFARALVGAYDPIALPPESTQIDWEVELVVVIGRTVRRARSTTARDAIAGYSIGNDVSVRDWQFRTRQALQGKTWEHSTPVGPMLVTADELDPSALRVATIVNGETMQESTTADLQFSPAELVEYISTFVTLDPGDLIFTGSPAGVGFSRDPQRFLREGDVLVTQIEGIGRCENRCVAERSWEPVAP